MDLAQLTEEPELTVTIRGQAYHFSEVPITSQGKLHTWIKNNVPDPLIALRSRLDGYPESVVVQLTADTRRFAPVWPPASGTPEWGLALMGTPQGQVHTLWIGLLVHQPTTTLEDADRVYRAMKKMRDAKLVKKIYGTIFGTDTSDDREESPDPKGSDAAQLPASNGTSSSARRNSVSR